MSQHKYNLPPEEAKRLRRALQTLKEEGPLVKRCGLCTYLMYGGAGAIPPLLVQEWPEFSGDPEYPVPHRSLRPGEAYHWVVDKWDRRTEYGKARWRLVDFLIEKLKKIVNEYEKRNI